MDIDLKATTATSIMAVVVLVTIVTGISTGNQIIINLGLDLFWAEFYLIIIGLITINLPRILKQIRMFT